MLRLRCCGAIAAITLIAGNCTKFDGHVDDLPVEIAEASAVEVPALTITQREEKLTIGTITVYNQTVLPDNDFFAPLVNSLHFVTQKHSIADELNFREGSTISRYELYDAERYIRLLDPVKQARVIPKYNQQTGKTDITVVTKDKLSAYVRGGGSGTGGYTTFGLQAGETSLFGRLYSIGGSYSRENFRDFVGLAAGKIRINGTRWETAVASLDGFSDSMHNYSARSVTIGHPFTIDGQRHAFRFYAGYSQGVLYDYLGAGIRKGYDNATGKSFDLIYRTRTETMTAEYLHGIGKKHRIEFGPGFEHYVRRDYFVLPADQYMISDTPALQVSPEAQKFYRHEQFSTHAATFTVNTRHGDYVPMTNFRKYLFTEDHFEGVRTTTRISHATPALGLEDHYTKAAFAAIYQDNFFGKKLRFESAVGRNATFWLDRYDIPRDDAWNADLRIFRFTPYGTLAIREYVAAGNNLSSSARDQIAGEFSRGFYYGSITPSAGFLSSLEYRSPGLKLPYILLAGVAFFDYAGVGTTLGTLSWNPIVGLGLRSMLYEFDNNVFRFDVGFNLNDSKFNLLNSLQFGLSQSF